MGEQRDRYIKNHENFALLLLNPYLNKFLNETKPEDELHLNNFIDVLFSKFYTDFTNMKMTKDNVRDTIMEQILEQACEDELKYKNINFQNIIGEIIENTEMGSYDSKKEEIMRAFFLTSRRYFPQMQKSISIKSISYMKYVFNNLKFNSKFSLGLLKVNFDNKLLEDDFNIVNIAELISEREKLMGICLKFNYDATYPNQNQSQDKTFFIKENIKFIFESIDRHFNLRAMVIAGNEYNSIYTFPSIVYDRFITTIRNDRLFALAISKINFDSNQIKELIGVLSGLNNLKFLILDFASLTIDLVDEIVNNYLQNNKKILFCALSGGNLSIDCEQKESLIKQTNPNFKYLLYIPQINLCLD